MRDQHKPFELNNSAGACAAGRCVHEADLQRAADRRAGREGRQGAPNASLAAVNDDTDICPVGEKVRLDLLVTIPPCEGSELIDDAGLGDGLGFGLTECGTLESRKAVRVLVLGNNANDLTSKAGSLARFQAEVVVQPGR